MPDLQSLGIFEVTLPFLSVNLPLDDVICREHTRVVVLLDLDLQNYQAPSSTSTCALASFS